MPASSDAPASPSALQGPDDTTAHARRWWALVVIALAQLMVVLDATIVNIALPRAQADLGISDADRAWVVTSYALAFGSLLLLGGRIADYWGRKRTFITGMAGFAVASAIGGLAQNGWELFAARALQGVFAALLAPAALALLTITCPSGRERGTAFAVFGTIAGGGAAVGLVLGGVLTEYASWRWCLLVNIPIALVGIAAAVPLLRESRASGSTRYDWPGVVLVALGLGSLVYGFTQAEDGWDRPSAWGLIAVGAVLLVAFVAVERRVANPLLPLRVPLHRDRGAAYLAALLTGATLLGGLLFLTFYFQIVLGYSPIRAGVASLPLTAAIMVTAPNVARIMPRTGPRPLMVIGSVVAALGLFWLTQISADGGFALHVLPGVLLLGAGLAFLFVPLQNTALVGVGDHDAGVASALVNACQQIGGSLGTAVFSTIALSATESFVPTAATGPEAGLQALVAGYSAVFWWAGGLTLLIAPIAFFLVKARKDDLVVAEGPVHVG